MNILKTSNLKKYYGNGENLVKSNRQCQYRYKKKVSL